MAYMKLTILGAGGVDADDNELEDLSMTTGSDALVGRCKMSAVYWTKSTDGQWSDRQNPGLLTFQLSLQYVEFRKQMYSPNSIEAYLLIKPIDIGTIKYKAFPSKEQLNKLFANRLVKLSCDEKEVCNDYYVHEFIPRKYADMMYVTLKIYSPDKMMTLEKYCRTWTAKRLGAEILSEEIGNFSITRNNIEMKLKLDTENMKHIKKKKKEHIFPYLVQYNETFYDFLARTTNRWGEFLYYEDGKLNIGFDDTKVEKVQSYDVMSYSDWNTSQPVQKNAGVCVNESPYDSNTLSSVVTQDGYNAVKYSIFQAFDKDLGADVYWMKKAGQLLTNNKSITNFVFDTMVDDLMAAGGSEVVSSKLNSNNYDEYFKKKQTIHGKLPDHDPSKESKGAHYSTNYDNKETYNEFSEASPILNENVYAQIVKGEIAAGQNVVSIEFDTTWPNVKLGQVIDVDGESFVVIEIVAYQPEAAKKNSQSYYERGYNSKVVKYRLKAVAKVKVTEKTEKTKTDDEGVATTYIEEKTILEGFFPPVLPTGHVRKSGPQIAVVVDVDDPLRANRVRVEYPWQLTEFMDAYNKKIDDELKDKLKDKKDEDTIKKITNEYESKKILKYENLTDDSLKDIDVTSATPWLFYTSPSGPENAGLHARHYLAEKVMVDYSNGNVERPYVVGAVSRNIPLPLKTSSAVMRAPNGEQVKVHEGVGNGAAAFIAGLTPGLKIVNSFIPFSFTPDSDESRCFEGGVEIGDKYGIWSIKGSTDGRNVSISSPWGDVKISAFTGITLSAPNGNIKIEGKNVEISAGNNLTLTSGTNIKNKFASLYDGTKKHKVFSWGTDVASAVAKKTAKMVASVVDLSLLRSVIELFWKPQEGTLAVSSNRFLKLEAAGSKAGFPDTLYKHPEKKYEEDYEKNMKLTLQYGKAMSELVSKVGSVVDKLMENYKDLLKDYKAKVNAFNDATESLAKFSNDINKQQNQRGSVCNGWDGIKDKIWRDETTEIKESDLQFNNDLVGVQKEENVKDDEGQVILIMESMTGFGRQNKMIILSKKKGAEAKKFILTMRKEKREQVLKAANEVLKSVKNLKALDISTATSGVGYTFGTLNYYVPEDYIKMLREAFKKEKCGNTAFYSYIENFKDPNYQVDPPALRPLALKRRVALNLVEGWGIKPSPISKKIVNNQIEQIEAPAPPQEPAKPVSDEDFEGLQWKLYVESLKFGDEVHFFKKAVGPATTFVESLKKNVSFWKPITEYYSWGNAKNGKILFAQENSYMLKIAERSATIDSMQNSTYSKGSLKRSDLGEVETRKLDDMINPIRAALLGIKGAGEAHGQGNDNQQQEGAGGQEQNIEE